MMSFLLSLLALLASASLPVRVTPVDGTAYDAQWLGVDSDGLRMQVDGEERTISLDALQVVQRRGEAASGSPRLRVQLRDGSQLAADAVTMADGDIVVQLRRQGALQLPTDQVRWIRFRPSTPAVESQWLGMLDRDTSSDTLVIQRESDKLDRIGGIITGITADSVAFDLDGQAIDAPTERLEGVLFGGKAAEAKAPAIRLTDTYGSVWNLAELRDGNEEGTVTLVSVSGLEHPVPMELIDKIELASSVQFLAASEAATSSYRPHIAAPEGVERLDQWLGPHSDNDRDLILRSQSSIEYRVDPGFQKFISTMAIDPSVEQGGVCDIRVYVDGEEAWHQTLQVNGQPLGVELPLRDASRIRIEVADGGDGDIGDVVRFRQPRLIK